MNDCPITKFEVKLPGFSPQRLVALIQRAIEATGLDLSGMTVLTEAATGAYGVTAVVAALAGAKRVRAFTKASTYGSIDDVLVWMRTLTGIACVDDRVDIIDMLSDDLLRDVDIVTNSGHLRPISADLIDRLPETAVIGLMFEAWEFRADDLDLDACLRRGIPVVGVNERHPALDVFSFLGPLCAKQLHDCGLAVRHNRIALLCDNDFGPPIASALKSLGAQVTTASAIEDLPADDWDAAVVALSPNRAFRVGQAESHLLAARLPPHAVVVQFWGDIDRDALSRRKLRFWPIEAPKHGHMAALLSELGPEPIIRLQTGGLRAAECARRGLHQSNGGFVQLLTKPYRLEHAV